MVMKVVKEDLNKIFARADITESTQWISVKKTKRGVFYTVLGTCQKTFITCCTYVTNIEMLLFK